MTAFPAPATAKITAQDGPYPYPPRHMERGPMTDTPERTAAVEALMRYPLETLLAAARQHRLTGYRATRRQAAAALVDHHCGPDCPGQSDPFRHPEGMA